ncbi:ABC transporter ATP-binding protein [Haloferax volcanii]|uniref:ABC-type transport system ATP-binding protein n=1 Tax=Haloferax volcanii JCM 10717 TaxID=1227458 RepID=M0HZH3_HALVO|nr:ABC transporter ATP-binding protein [Haloferax alexandrinus]ELZ89886.1 ABC-type transport system ATP-binding protein [Haloferax alexandrinus JCM 10717]
MNSTEPAIELETVTKKYGDVRAVDSLDLVVERGETYGFLGPNGAGKSTTIGLLLDYLRPTSGTVRVLGHDPRGDVVAVHDRVGVLPDRFGLYEDRSARQHVALVAETKRAGDDPENLLERVGLGDAVDDEVGDFSSGMEQRLALAMALVGDPDLLILDEPFSGVDPHGVRRVREIVREENERGATVFFSSHVLGQVEVVCDRIGVLHGGQLVAEGTLDDLRARTASPNDATMEDVFVELTDARADDGGDRR